MEPSSSLGKMSEVVIKHWTLQEHCSRQGGQESESGGSSPAGSCCLKKARSTAGSFSISRFLRPHWTCIRSENFHNWPTGQRPSSSSTVIVPFLHIKKELKTIKKDQCSYSNADRPERASRVEDSTITFPNTSHGMKLSPLQARPLSILICPLVFAFSLTQNPAPAVLRVSYSSHRLTLGFGGFLCRSPMSHLPLESRDVCCL